MPRGPQRPGSAVDGPAAAAGARSEDRPGARPLARGGGGSGARTGQARRDDLTTEHNTWDRYRPATRRANAATFGRQRAVIAVSAEVARSFGERRGAAGHRDPQRRRRDRSACGAPSAGRPRAGSSGCRSTCRSSARSAASRQEGSRTPRPSVRERWRADRRRLGSRSWACEIDAAPVRRGDRGGGAGGSDRAGRVPPGGVPAPSRVRRLRAGLAARRDAGLAARGHGVGGAGRGHARRRRARGRHRRVSTASWSPPATSPALAAALAGPAGGRRPPRGVGAPPPGPRRGGSRWRRRCAGRRTSTTRRSPTGGGREPAAGGPDPADGRRRRAGGRAAARRGARAGARRAWTGARCSNGSTCATRSAGRSRSSPSSTGRWWDCDRSCDGGWPASRAPARSRRSAPWTRPPRRRCSGSGSSRASPREAVAACEAEGVSLVFNTPNDRSRPGYLKMGWEVVAVWPVWVQAAAAGPPRGGGAPPRPAIGAGRGAAGHDGARARRRRRSPRAGGRRAGVEPEVLHTPRSLEYLRWRYAEGPLPYHVLSRDAATVVTRLRARGRLREAVVCEAFARRGRARRTCASCSRSLPREAGADHAVAHLGPGWPGRSELRPSGYRGCRAAGSRSRCAPSRRAGPIRWTRPRGRSRSATSRSSEPEGSLRSSRSEPTAGPGSARRMGGWPRRTTSLRRVAPAGRGSRSWACWSPASSCWGPRRRTRRCSWRSPRSSPRSAWSSSRAPRIATDRSPPGSSAFALGAHVVGSLLRFVIIQAVYHGVADANGYYGAGVRLAPLFRSFQFPPLPQTGTSFMNWCTGLLFAITTPTMLGGFVVCGALGFVGSWYFYKRVPTVVPERRSPAVRVPDLPAADHVVLAVEPRQGRPDRAVPRDRDVRVRADPSLAPGTGTGDGAWSASAA